MSFIRLCTVLILTAGLGACAASGSHSADNTFYGEVKTGYETSHTSH